MTFSLLPDCLAARLPGTLDEVEQVLAHTEQAPSFIAATDASRRDAVELPKAAVRSVFAPGPAGPSRPDVSSSACFPRKHTAPVRQPSWVRYAPTEIDTRHRARGVTQQRTPSSVHALLAPLGFHPYRIWLDESQSRSPTQDGA